MAYIYQITNLINGRIYVGKTLDTIKEIMSGSLCTSDKQHNSPCSCD